MRRQIVLAVIFLAAFIVLLRLAVLAGEFDTVITAAAFEAARDDRTALRAFLHRMPKGGDLHTHLAGAVYAIFFAVCVCDAPTVIRVLFGPEYTHVSAGALRWLAAAPLCYLAGALSTSALQAVRRRPMIVASALVALAVNVVLNLVLIPRLAGTGAALATTVSYAVLAVVALAGLARAGVRVPLARALLAPVLTGGAMAGLLLALPLPGVAAIVVATAVVGGAWLAGLSLIGRMGGSHSEGMP